MNEDLKLIKKKYGENMAHFCRDYFPILLEQKGLLPKLLLEHFEPSKFLYDDIVKHNIQGNFKDFIYSLVNVENIDEDIPTKSPKELLSEAGYDLYECKTEEDIQSFRKYYQPNEELCTFHGGRLNHCHVFFAVKKDVDKIRRQDFKEPKRQDLYGTSVISIQFEKDSSHLLSIKNRYNHRVVNPDATFSNNLDNIIPGLTKSFEKYYGMVQTFKLKNSNFEIPSYVCTKKGKYYKYNNELHGIYYCPNNIIIDTNGIHKFEDEKYIVMDYLILDLVNKKISLYDKRIRESFHKTIGEIEKINVLNTDYGKEVTITNKNNEKIIIKLDKENKIIGYINKNIEKIEDNFLNNNIYLTEIDLPNVKIIRDGFLAFNKAIDEISLPNVEKIGNDFLDSNEVLDQISLPNAKIIGDRFLPSNQILNQISLPNVEKIGDDFMRCSQYLEKVNLPNVKIIEDGFLYDNIKLREIDLPNVEKIGYDFLDSNEVLDQINLPNVKEILGLFLPRNIGLKKVSLPNVEVIGDGFLNSNEALDQISLPNVKKILSSFLDINIGLKKVSLPNVEIIGNDFLNYNNVLDQISLPSVIEIGDCFLENNKNLKELDLPNVKKIGKKFLCHNQKLTQINLPSAEIIGNKFLRYNLYLKKLDLPYIKEIYDDCLSFNIKLRELNLPNVEKIGSYFLGGKNRHKIAVNAPNLITIEPNQATDRLFVIAQQNEKKGGRKL